jgi:hypothetical protein
LGNYKKKNMGSFKDPSLVKKRWRGRLGILRVKYFECVRVALVIQHAECIFSVLYYIVVCDVSFCHIFPCYLINGIIIYMYIYILNRTWVFWIFSTTSISNISHTMKNSASYHKFTLVSIQSSRYSCQILMRIFLTYFRPIHNITLHQSCSMWTDWLIVIIKLVVTFYNFLGNILLHRISWKCSLAQKLEGAD